MKKLLIGLGIVFLIIIILLVVIGASGLLKSYSAEPFISDFYHQYDTQNFSYIYNSMCDEKFKSATSEEGLTKLLSGAYQNLGAVKDRKKGAWKIFYGSDGMYFSIQYSVTHEKGASTDSFTLRKQNNSWLIYYYHIDSPELAKLVAEFNKKSETIKEPIGKLSDNVLTPHTEAIIKTPPASAEPVVVKNNVIDTSSLSDIKLSATTASGAPESRIAVINNTIYHTGDSVANYKIDEIKDSSVVLVDSKGDKHEIHI